jgi:hypothetical protein
MGTMTTKLVTYGTPDQAALLFDGLTKVVEREPNRTFADDDVRTSARRLANLILVRLDGEAPGDDD